MFSLLPHVWWNKVVLSSRNSRNKGHANIKGFTVPSVTTRKPSSEVTPTTLGLAQIYFHDDPIIIIPMSSCLVKALAAVVA